MKTLQDLKNAKVIQAIKTIDVDETWEQEKIDRTIRNLQPMYYDDKNAIEIVKKETKNNRFYLTVSCKKFINYPFEKDFLKLIEDNSKSIIVERIEEINRYKVTATGFEFTFEFPIPIYEQVQGELTIKPSMRYIFNGSHNNAIKAKNLLKNDGGYITGFTKRTFAGEKITYKFILK